jgi:hypothetical protein
LIAYRLGSRTSDNLTPRPDKDTVGRPGQAPGLSVQSTAKSSCKSQCIDLDRLTAPLAAIPDDPSKGGTSGHIAIAPVDLDGKIDLGLLHQWAASRGTSRTHVLTQILLDAIVGEFRG